MFFRKTRNQPFLWGRQERKIRNFRPLFAKTITIPEQVLAAWNRIGPNPTVRMAETSAALKCL